MLSTVGARASTNSEPRTTDALRRKACALLRCETQFIPNAEFHHDGAELRILGCEAAWDAAVFPGARVPKDLPAHLARLCETELLSADDERSLFRRMNYLKFRANAIRSTLDPEDPSKHAVEFVESYLDEAQKVRDHIVNANMRLVISIVKKFVTPQLSFDDMLSDGIWALVQCVNKFDFDRGFRFSTYAYRSIARSLYRKIMDAQKELARYSRCGSGESGFDVEDDERSSSMDEQTWSTLRDLLGDMMHKLDRRERFVIRGRYALGAHRKARTFQCLADKLGVSKERVRQLEQRAVKKLRTMAARIDLDQMCNPASC